jgi:hypothetical protein
MGWRVRLPLQQARWQSMRRAAPLPRGSAPLGASDAVASECTSARVTRRAASTPAERAGGGSCVCAAAGAAGAKSTSRRSMYASRGRDADVPSSSTTACLGG